MLKPFVHHTVMSAAIGRNQAGRLQTVIGFAGQGLDDVLEDAELAGRSSTTRSDRRQ